MDSSVIEASVEFDYTAQEPDELTLRKGDLITGIRVQSGGWWEGLLVRENRRGMFPDNFVRVLGDAAQDTTVVMRKKPGRKCRVLFSYAPANADELELHVDDVIDVLNEVEEGWWRGRLRNRTGVFPSNFVEEMPAGEAGAVAESRGIRKESNNNSTTVNVNVSVKTETPAATIVDVVSMPPEVPSSPVPTLDEEVEESAEVKEEDNVVEVVTSNTSTTTIPCLPPKPVKERCKVLYPYEAQNEDELNLKEEDIVVLISKDAPDKGWWKGELNGRVGLFPDNFVAVLPSTEESSIKSEKPSPAKSTTNRIRDSITKPSETTAALRKSLDLTAARKEDDTKSSPPPHLKQKPPPPVKKPQRSPTLPPTSPNLSKHSMKFSLPFPPPPSSSVDSPVSETNNNNTTSNKTQISIPSNPAVGTVDATNDSLDGSCISRSGSYSVTSVNCNVNNSTSHSAIVNNHHPSNVDSNSSVIRRSSTSGVVGGGSSDNERRTSGGAQSSDSEFEGMERPTTGAKLTHLTANRARAPRRRPPSAVITKEESQEVASMMNGVAEAHIVEKIVNKISPTPSVPWVEELKMNQAKKNSQAQGKTRVTIGPFNATSTSSSVADPSPSPAAPTPSSVKSSVGVVFRSQRPASMFTPDVNPPPPSLTRNNSTAACNKPPLPSSSGVSPVPAGGLVTPVTTPLTTGDSTTVTISSKQWTELLDKVNKLESIVESQSVLIQELNRKVKSGQDKQMSMQNEMEKLMDLVTQV
uniref:SH3 domain-containing kinase-binding protein 1 n=1 Tax=Cacopsylla melanoneura TaxID=428564 RepID=A0A8D8TVV9_9HEMI